MGRDDRALIRTRDDLLELIAHALRLQLSYLSKDQALAVADTILRTFKAAIIDPAAQIMPAARGSGGYGKLGKDHPGVGFRSSSTLPNASR
jgi:hypothetical protein